MSIPNSFNPMGTLGAVEPLILPVMTGYSTYDATTPHSCALVVTETKQTEGNSAPAWMLLDGKTSSIGQIFTSLDSEVGGFAKECMTLNLSRPVVVTGVALVTSATASEQTRFSRAQVRAVVDGSEVTIAEISRESSFPSDGQKYEFKLLRNGVKTQELRIYANKSIGKITAWTFRNAELLIEGYHP